MNCQEALAVLYEIIDNEADRIDAEAFHRHLQECRHCFDIYRVERSFQELVTARARTLKVDDHLEHLRRNVLSRLDEIDHEEPTALPSAVETTRPGLFSLQRVLAIAASLVLLLGAGVIGLNIYQHHKLYVPLERAHWQTEKALEQFRDETHTAVSESTVRNRYGFSLAPRVGEYSLIGGNVEEVMGIRMEHFVYANGNQRVSVFVAPASEFTIPKELYDHPATKDGGFYEHVCRGCRLLYHRADGAVIVTATKDRDVEMLQFVPGTAVI